MRPARHPRVRVYRTLRSAHLERAAAEAAQGRPVSLLHRFRRYDFDASLAAGTDVQQLGPWRTAAVLLVSRVERLEVNEPLMAEAAPSALLAALAARAGARLRGARRPRVVAYAIANLAPPRGAGGRARIRSVLARWSGGRLLALTDRLAVGTPGALDLYEELLPRQLATCDHRLVPALPAPCSCPRPRPDEGAGAETAGAGVDGRARTVLFVGALERRKGAHLLLQAWPAVSAARPGSRLVLVGRGQLEAEAAHLASGDDVDLVVDPPRARVHEALRGASVLVLLSQRTRGWREQVGLPLVEGLAHGCAVVTTQETGLAGWLQEHGHRVLPAEPSVAEVAAALVAALDERRPASSVLDQLPGTDGRLEADAWLEEQPSRPS